MYHSMVKWDSPIPTFPTFPTFPASCVAGFQPETTFMVGAAQSMPGLANTVQLEATSPCSASLVLAKHFWPETSKAVVAKCDNYAAPRREDM